MRILVASPCCEWAYSQEAKRQGVSRMTIDPIFDETASEQLVKMVSVACEEEAKVIIIDNHLVPADVLPISPTEMDFARGAQTTLGFETFFLNNRNPLSAGELSYRRREQIRFDSQLWRALKPVKIPKNKESVLRTVKIGEFDEVLFNYKTGKVERVGGGDGGQDHAAHLVREGFAHWDHNWLKIIEAVAKELKPESVTNKA